MAAEALRTGRGARRCAPRLDRSSSGPGALEPRDALVFRRYLDPDGRHFVATRTAHACVAALPEILDGDLCVAIMHGDDRLARALAIHIARAAGGSEDDDDVPGLRSSLDARPVPRAVLLEMRPLLGETLARDLEAPLAVQHVRVLWLSAHAHEVVDIPVETSHVVAFEKEFQVIPDESLRIDPDELANEERDVAGTWKDPSHYLPLPLPKGWVIDRIDQIGVLTVIIDDRVVLDLCAMEIPEKVVFAALRRTMSRGTVVEKEAKRVLDRLRNVRRPFKDFNGEELIQRIFGESRVWGALVVEGAERGKA
jgi:hypothetical protein